MSTKQVLVVDDDLDHRSICTTILRHQGYDVLEAGDGEEAIRVAREQLPDVIVMDGMLPTLDGWAATERLKGAPETEHIPVIMLTARALTQDRERSWGAGVDRYLAKPCEPLRIAEEVRSCVGAPDGSDPGP